MFKIYLKLQRILLLPPSVCVVFIHVSVCMHVPRIYIIYEKVLTREKKENFRLRLSNLFYRIKCYCDHLSHFTKALKII
jgi:hypothetical protein